MVSDLILHIDKEFEKVLILVVMEDGLWQQRKAMSAQQLVLILVVMEDGLWLLRSALTAEKPYRLNPCCNGRWSQTAMVKI